MSAPATLRPLDWDQLLILIDDGHVVPIIGADVVVVEGERGPRPLVEYVACWLEEHLDLPRTEGSTLNDVACRYLARDGAAKISKLYSAVRTVLARHPVEIPDTLRKLARIRTFDLFVTTTFDGLLVRALDAERFDGALRTRSVAYSPSRLEDLPDEEATPDGPVVYQLLGRVSSLPDYAVTDEDTLEWLHSLQSANRRPTRLIDALNDRATLIIGSGYPDWLARFFLRTARRSRLLLAPSRPEVVADARVRDDLPLRTFPRHFSEQTEIYEHGPVEFVNELSRRWEERQGAEPGEARHDRRDDIVAPAASDPSRPEIFVSYAREDFAVAKELADSLRRAGLPAWLDLAGGIRGGEDFEREIRRRIGGAAFFVPVISPRVLTRERRFLKMEWRLACEVAQKAPFTLPFIVPLRVGDVPADHAELPDPIRRAHWVDSAGGTSFDEIVATLREYYDEFLRNRRGGER